MKRALAFGLMLALSACAGTPHGGYRPVSDTPARIGKPYSVHGQTYVPAAQPYYDALGYASWYGPESGGATANGEHFRPDGISAAHTTLPLPTYVEVTALETGRVIIVRVNDQISPLARRIANHLATLALCCSSVLAKAWPPVPSATI